MVAELSPLQGLNVRFKLPLAALLVGEQAVVVLALEICDKGCGSSEEEEACGGGFDASGLHLRGYELFPGGCRVGVLSSFHTRHAC